LRFNRHENGQANKALNPTVGRGRPPAG
jgi:hypothetical protein